MTRIFFAVVAALLVSVSESRSKAPPPSDGQLTQVQLASAPSNVVTLTQAQTVTESVLQPLRACGCTSAPSSLDVLILLGLLALRSVCEPRVRNRAPSGDADQPGRHLALTQTSPTAHVL